MNRTFTPNLRSKLLCAPDRSRYDSKSQHQYRGAAQSKCDLSIESARWPASIGAGGILEPTDGSGPIYPLKKDNDGLWSAHLRDFRQEKSYEHSDHNRKGDHICYVSDSSKMKAHYPSWDLTRNLRTTFEEIYQAWQERNSGSPAGRIFDSKNAPSGVCDNAITLKIGSSRIRRDI